MKLLISECRIQVQCFVGTDCYLVFWFVLDIG